MNAPPHRRPFPSRLLGLLILPLVLAASTGLPAPGTMRRTQADESPPGPKIVLIAGAKSHGPGHHEYEKGLELLAHCLRTSPDTRTCRVEVHRNGWPQDERTLDDADSILLFSDGADHDEAAHPLLSGDRLDVLRRQMARGCGLVALHYTLFVPNRRGAEEFLDWLGGYFDYENGTDDPRGWYSAIGTHTARFEPASDHPVCRGVAPIDLHEEYYYQMRFRPDDPRRTSIARVHLPGREQPEVVAWAVERGDGGRGFAFTGGHFHSNWSVREFRRLVLNALVWTAGAEVPANGVDSTLPADFEARPRPDDG